MSSVSDNFGQLPSSWLWTLKFNRGLISHRIHEVISERKLRTLVQPIMSLAEPMRPVGYELLTRVTDPAFNETGGFFRAVDECGLMDDIAPVLYTRVMATLLHFRDQTLFVNCHPSDLGRLARALDVAHTWCRFRSSQLVLEISEQARLPEADFRHELEMLTALGFRLAIDNVGVQSLNLSRLELVKPAFIKLDRSLVHHLHREPFRRGFVKFLAGWCKELGAQLLATGIEHVDDLHCLQDLGCHGGQGYLLASPVSLSDE